MTTNFHRKERPLLFAGSMVRATLDGTKTQTRRMVKLPIEYDGRFAGGWKIVRKAVEQAVTTFNQLRGKTLGIDVPLCPYGQPGDRLWVRETWQKACAHADDDTLCIAYAASQIPGKGGWIVDNIPRPNGVALWSEPDNRWRPSIHMPRWASRILLEVVSVRAERLQDISAADAIAEGIEGCDVVINGHNEGRTWRDYSVKCDDPCEWFANPIDSYRSLWVSINGAGSWEANPWVWVVEFKLLHQK